MAKHRFIMILLVLFVLLAFAGVSQGQDESSCPALVTLAMTEIGDNCDAMDRNNACYGFNRVDTAFFEPQTADFFSTPADRSSLSLVQSLQTSGLNDDLSEWGVVLMNVQANVPGGLPGQAVVFILYGDVEVENAVEPDAAFVPGEPVDVTSLVNANGRGGPGTNYNVVTSVPVGAVVAADGLNNDKTWVRVVHERTPLWISRDLVRPEVRGTLNDLPVITGNRQTPMQAIHLRTGFGGAECQEAPSTLMIQGPDTMRVNISVNGADIEIGSTIGLRIFENQMQLMALAGVARVAGIDLPAGFTMQVPLNEAGEDVAGPWTGFRGLTGPELASLRFLEQTPGSLLHYPLLLPSLGDIARTRAAISRPVSRPANPPEPGAEATELPEPPADGDCGVFLPTAPLDAASVGPYTFYWDPAPGADLYRWILLDANGGVLSIFDTTQTNFTADLKPDYTSTIQWEVHAEAGGQVICTTYRVVIPLFGTGGESQPPAEIPLYEITDPRECIRRGGYWDRQQQYCSDTPPPPRTTTTIIN